MKKALIFSFLVVIIGFFIFNVLNVFTSPSVKVVEDEPHEVDQVVKLVKGEKTNTEVPMGIVAGEIEVTLHKSETSNTNEKTTTFLYSLKNQTENEVIFEFESELMFDYRLIDEKGNIVSYYSKDQNFAKELQSVNIIQGEALSTEINFHNLAKGIYHLEVWLVGYEAEYKKENTFTVD